jgi:outer membrane receptor for ferrienterochelin and colicins
MFKKRLLYTVFLMGQLGLVQSQMSALDSVHTLQEIVVTGAYKATGVDKAVVPTRIISVDKLRTIGVQSVGDLLKFQANLRIQQDNILGAGLSMQGLSGENVKILIDGIPVIGRQNGNIDLNQLNLQNVERIEIVEGPLSVQYGTNALAGTINIITKKTPSKQTELSAMTHYESVGHINFAGTVGLRGRNERILGIDFENIATVISGGRNFFNGWSDVDTSRYKQWKPRVQHFLDWNAHAQSGKTRVGYVGSVFDEFILNRGKPLAPYFENAFDDHYRTRRFMQGMTFNRTLDNGYNSNLQIAYNHFRRIKNTFYRDLVNLQNIQTENAGDQDTTRFTMFTARGTYAQTGQKNLRFESGFDVNIENGTGLRIKNASQQIGDYAAFTSLEWVATPQLTIRPGLRATYNSSYKAPLIPSLNIRWQLDSVWTMRASYGMGFRAPSLKELYFYFVDINHNIRGNENLNAETSHNINVFLNAKKVINDFIFKVEANGFFNQIKNLITLAQIAQTTNEFGYINIGVMKTTGGQVFLESVVKNTSWAIGTAYTARINTFNNQTYSAGTWELRGNATWRLPKWGVAANLWYKYSGAQPGFVLNENGTVENTHISGFHIADMGVSKKVFKDKCTLTTGIKNLFNVRNIASQLAGGAHSSSNGTSAMATGRNFYINCQIIL